MKYLTNLKDEFQLMELISLESLKVLNSLFKTNYQPQHKSITTIHRQIRTEFKEIAKLMRTKPERGGYGV
ncbi:MAG: hypothetical protein ACYDIA_01835 [Candidatus Humimicrobiaceae bacterium]